MSEDQKPSGQSEVTSGDKENQQTESQAKEDKVSYDTYKKVLAEAKAAKEKAKVLESEVQKFSQSEMQAQGKQAELIESLRKQVGDKDGQLKDFKKNYAFKLLTAAVEAEGAKHGCVDTDLLLKSMDLNAIEFGDDFSVNGTDIQREVTSVVGKKPYLFNKKISSVNDVNPKVNKESLNGKEDLSKLSLAEKIKKVAEMSASGIYNKRGTN
jgi:hypothetical protein